MRRLSSIALALYRAMDEVLHCLALSRPGIQNLCMAMLLLCLASASHASGRITRAAYLFFEPGQTEVRGESIDKLARLKCFFGDGPGQVIAVGFASGKERNPGQIAKLRAEAVKDWFMSAGLDASNIYIDSRGARQPAGDDRTREGQTANRRVELELVGGRVTRKAEDDCGLLAWQRSLLALEGDSATVVARSLLRSNWVTPTSLFWFARQQKRSDLFDLLAGPQSGIVLSRNQREEFARAALSFGKLDYFLRWLRSEGATQEDPQLGRYFERLCWDNGDSQGHIDVVDALRRLNATPPNNRALLCASGYRSPEVLEAYLRAGYDRFITPELVVDTGRRPLALERLLKYGADPRSRKNNTTLFHTTPLNSIADVQRLLDWGLDINALDPHPPISYAIYYAKPEVLDFMKQAGAKVDDVRLLSNSGRNPAAQIWLIRNGLHVDDVPATVGILINGGEVELPVLAAMKDQGIDLNARNSAGQNALLPAIQRYSPTAVQFLVSSGVDSREIVDARGGRPRTAIEEADSLSEVLLSNCISGTPCPSSDKIDPYRQQRKQEILRILRAAKPAS